LEKSKRNVKVHEIRVLTMRYIVEGRGTKCWNNVWKESPLLQTFGVHVHNKVALTCFFTRTRSHCFLITALMHAFHLSKWMWAYWWVSTWCH